MLPAVRKWELLDLEDHDDHEQARPGSEGRRSLATSCWTSAAVTGGRCPTSPGRPVSWSAPTARSPAFGPPRRLGTAPDCGLVYADAKQLAFATGSFDKVETASSCATTASRQAPCREDEFRSLDRGLGRRA